MRLHAHGKILGFVAFAAMVGLACSDDDPAPAGAGSSSGDGGASSSSSSGNASSSSSGTVAEPTCTASGKPTWEKVDPKLDWTKADSVSVLAPFDNGATGLAYGNGVFVLLAATANHDRVRWATSSDGVTWTDHQQKTTETGQVTVASELHYTGKKFVFFAGHTNNGTFAYSSADGVTWTANRVSDGAVNVSAFTTGDNGVTVASGANGSLRSSADLTTWANHGEGVTSYLNVAAGAGRFVVTSNGAGTVFGGTDGSAWSPLTISPTPPGGFPNLVFGRGLFVMAGSGGYLTSTDGTQFAVTERSGDSALKTSNGQPFFGGNRFVLPFIDYFTAVATFADSTDGKAWNDFGTLDLGKDNAGTAVRAMAFGQCRYVALGRLVKGGGMGDEFSLLEAAGSPAP